MVKKLRSFSGQHTNWSRLLRVLGFLVLSGKDKRKNLIARISKKKQNLK
jgi:hypothetical protein